MKDLFLQDSQDDSPVVFSDPRSLHPDIFCVSAKYCYVTHELRLHQNDRCKRFTLF